MLEAETATTLAKSGDFIITLKARLDPEGEGVKWMRSYGTMRVELVCAAVAVVLLGQ